MKTPTTALLWLVLLIAPPLSHAQSTPTERCSETERQEAASLSKQLLTDLRNGLDSSFIRRRYLAPSCQPVLNEFVNFDKSLSKDTDCEAMQEFGVASIQFLVQVADCGFRAETWPSEDPLRALPREVARLIHENPILERAIHSEQKIRIATPDELVTLTEALRKISSAALRYSAEHPELADRAASRWAAIAKEIRKDADCLSSNEAPYFGLPKDTPIIVTVDSVFVLAILRDQGELKVGKMLLVSE